MKSSYTCAIIATELFSALICLLLLFGNIFETRRRTMRSMIYSVMVSTNTAALLADAVSWWFEGNPAHPGILFWSTTASIVLSILLIGQFNLYIWYFVSEHKRISDDMLRVAMIFSSVCAGLTFIGCVGGWMFSYDNGIYQTGVLFGVYLLINVLCVVVDVLFVLCYRRELTLHDRLAVYCYAALPTISTVISVFVSEWAFSYAACTLSLVILYIMIQSEQGRQLEKEQQLSRFFAMHDELTGLNSRHAYTERLEELVQKDGNVGIVFGDVNALKYTNDHFGHTAGDNRLKTFASMLTAVFPAEDVFKISGDEFVVMTVVDKKEGFDKQTAKLQEALGTDDNPIASMGFAHGTCRNVNELVQNAEMKMYVHKDIYHKNHPETVR